MEALTVEGCPAYEIATLDLRGLEKTEVESKLYRVRFKTYH
ncbi:MAG: hypothetical protein V7K64_14075 [Nostoc sp.]|nr:hypothetical protein [Nostoc sp. JL34]